MHVMVARQFYHPVMVYSYSRDQAQRIWSAVMSLHVLVDGFVVPAVTGAC